MGTPGKVSILRRFLHWGPLTAIAIMKTVTVMTLYMNSMWWPPNTSTSAYINHKLFIIWSTLTAVNFAMAAIVGPKYVPLKWRPKKPKQEAFLQYCKFCEGFKAPRSHHCRQCNRCILRMDHHCPWINNCVGWGNHAYFIYFLTCAVIGCAHASFILLASLIRGLNRYTYLYNGQYHLATVEFSKVSLVLCILGLGMAIGVTLAVGMLLVFQMVSVCKNRTVIEDWIMIKAKHRREGTGTEFVYPYNLGVWKNIRQVLPAPFSCATVGDGIWWPVNDQCDQFTLTREQLAQKEEKRVRTKTYTIVKPATGSWFPLWSQGFRVACRPPCTDEPRIKLQVGDVVKVTRWMKHWLFGEKVQQLVANGENGDQSKKPESIRIKGWFPRKCAVHLVENDEEDQQYVNREMNQHQTTDRKRK